MDNAAELEESDVMIKLPNQTSETAKLQETYVIPSDNKQQLSHPIYSQPYWASIKQKFIGSEVAPFSLVTQWSGLIEWFVV